MRIPDGSLLLGADTIVDSNGDPAPPEPQNMERPPWETLYDQAGPGGVLCMGLDGQVTVMGGEELLAIFRGSKSRGDGLAVKPVYVDHGKAAWLVGSVQAGALTLVDLQTGMVLDHGPREAVSRLISVRDDGTFIFFGNSGIAAFNPKGSEARIALPVIASIDAVAAIETGDGAIWGFDETQGLM